MASPTPQNPYNAQLVSHLHALTRLHAAEPGPEDAFTLYHIVQETSPATSSAAGLGPALPALGHALAGSLATASTKALLYPLDLVITRLQVQRQLRGPGEADSAARDADAEYSDLVDAVRKIKKSEGGLAAFYTGCLPDVGKGVVDSFVFFLAYTFLRQREAQKLGGKGGLSVGRELGVGVVAGAAAKLVTTPVQNVVTRLQTAALVAARDPVSDNPAEGETTAPDTNANTSVRAIARAIHAERGLAGFWAGYSASLLLTLNPALTFATDNLLTRLHARARRAGPSTAPASPQLTFAIAALSKALATALTYPAMLAKARAQTGAASTLTATAPSEKGKARFAPPEPSAPWGRALAHRLRALLAYLSTPPALLRALRTIYAQEGARGLYSGLGAEVLKGLLSHGLTMMVKERTHVGVIRGYYLLLRGLRQWPEGFGVKEGVEGVAGGVKGGFEGVGEGVRGVVGDGAERVENVGVTVGEGVKGMVGDGARKVGVGEGNG